MHYIVSYDVTDDGTRRRISKVCESYGQRLQKSVFTCNLDKSQLADMMERLMKVRNAEPFTIEDSICVFPICAECLKVAQSIGASRNPLHAERYVVIIG